ncbi:DUF3280 domain-containing protein [Mesorhizobium sp. BAC0120]|uniref:DUF3280 domain-containing protein n=1 Tax=Mesorhizobium sp. BAC0120 TaxID=3090670 RepID=UPI00298C0055|nr:DUF3280 domain-containing protein [Mesorhizobium sp. BAC0120]MDW6026424.1 DUF3280 domain-containing protein [Mesorhizobium sp. BAC0120]
MTLAQLFSIAKSLTFLFTASFGACVAAYAGQPVAKMAVFDFELEHGSQVPGTPDHHDAEQARLRGVSERLRDNLARAGFAVIDIAPIAKKAAAAKLTACGNCADGFAEEIGADYAFTGAVYKVSELILSMNVVVRDAKTAQPVTSAIVDFRGNTDESWRRAIDYLYRNVLSQRLEKLKK